ncbi:MAG: hypothetical protein ACI8UO_002103 [Verrucomicrobiales bacterium]|jgi:hypothetical protein
MHPRLFALAIFIVLTGEGLQARALLPARDWTSNDGKTIHAELLRFDGDNTMLRMQNGSVYELPDVRFARKDQALLLFTRLKSSFRHSYSAVLNANFFYSKQLAEDDWVGRCYGYIGSDSERIWLRLALYVTGGELGRSTAIVTEGEGDPVRVPLNFGKIEHEQSGRRDYEHLDLSLIDLAYKAAPLLEAHEDLMFFFENETGVKIPHPLSEIERLALREVAIHFRKVSNLAEDKTWWTAFRVRKPGDPEKTAVKTDPLDQFRDPDHTPILPIRAWTNALDQTVRASLSGFNGTNVVLKKYDGELLEIPLGSLQPTDQQLLIGKRLENFSVGEHPIDRDNRWYWPARGGADRLSRQTLLVAVDPQTNKPRLFLQQHSREFNGQRFSHSFLRGDLMDKEFRIPLDGQLDQFGGDSTWSWMELTGENLESTLQFAESNMIYYRIYDSDARSDTGAFRRAEVAASKEAISLYHWLNQVEAPKPGPSPIENF